MSFASIGVGGALAIGSVAGMAGSLGSAAMQSNSANAGAKRATNASLWGWDTGADYFNQSNSVLQPYNDLGASALWQIRNNLGWNPGQNGSGAWTYKPINPQQAAIDGGLDWNAITHQINAADLKNLTGYSPKEAYAPITRGKLNDFTGINVQNALGGYSPKDVQRLSGVDLSGLFNSVGSVGIQNPKKPKAQQAQSGGLQKNQQANFNKLQSLAQQGKLNDKQQANYLRLVGKLG